MRKGISAALTVLAIGAFAGSNALAASFSNKALNGNYVVSANGYLTDDNADQGQMVVNGVISFNGTGGVNLGSTDLTFVVADNSGPADNIVCQPTLTGGSYSINPDGTGSFNLTFSNNNLDCFGDPTATLDFFLALGRSGAAQNQMVLTDFTNLTLLDTAEEVESLTLQGSLQKQ